MRLLCNGGNSVPRAECGNDARTVIDGNALCGTHLDAYRDTLEMIAAMYGGTEHMKRYQEKVAARAKAKFGDAVESTHDHRDAPAP